MLQVDRVGGGKSAIIGHNHRLRRDHNKNNGAWIEDDLSRIRSRQCNTTLLKRRVFRQVDAAFSPDILTRRRLFVTDNDRMRQDGAELSKAAAMFLCQLEGSEACREGEELDSNPYPSGTLERLEWIAGWMKEQRRS